MSSTTVSKRLINSEEYYNMAEIGVLKTDEKVELIHGEIYCKAKIGSKHAAVRNHLFAQLFFAFDNEPNVRVQNPIRIDKWNEPEPDLVLLKYRKDRYISSHPKPSEVMGLIEISATSYDFYKNIKLSLYATSGIPVYWIVNLPESQIEVYSDPESEQYNNQRNYYSGDRISLLDKEFDVSEILMVS